MKGNYVLLKRIRYHAAKAMFNVRTLFPGRSLRSAYGPRLLKRPWDATYRFCITGVYGRLLSDFLIELDEDFVFLDIGANVGLYSLVASSNPSCRRAIAFEPVPQNFCHLVSNIALNGRDNVVPICAAVSSSPSSVLNFSFDPTHTGGSHLDANGRVHACVASQHLIETLTNEYSRVIAKIDVEGGEISVIEFMRSTKTYSIITDIFVEVAADHLGADGVSRLLSMLEDDGFAEVRRTGTETYYDAHFRRRKGSI